MVMNVIERLSHRTRIILGKEIDWSEHRKSFGNLHPDKTFYVIRRRNGHVGINSQFNTGMGHVRYAINHGWIPVIDMQNYPNEYLEPLEKGHKNAWEFYFNQPFGGQYSLNEVYKSRNVVLSSGEPLPVCPNDSMEFFTRPDLIRMWSRYFHKYIGFSPELSHEVNKNYLQYLSDKKEGRILGVSLRGTDYLAKPYEHPVQPSIEQALKTTRRVMLEQRCEWVYLTAEDIQILDAYKKEFGDKLIYIKEAQMYDKLLPGENIAGHSFDRENDKYLRGMEYMTQKALLTKCNCLIGGRTSGNVAAMVWQPEYDYTYFWNLGRYGIDDVLDEV